MDINKSGIAKIKKQGKTYEIFVDSEAAFKLRNGENVSINDAVTTEEIFYDAKKGERASENEFEEVFGTDDKLKICEIIIREGYVPMTAEHMRKELEIIKKQIVNLIHKNSVDAKTGKPHPLSRIESAIEQAKVKIDVNRSAEEQLKTVVDALRLIIPIKFEIRELSLKILAEHSGRVFPVLKKYGKLIKEDWQSDGNLLVILEIPAGLQEDLEVDLNKITKGTTEMKILKAR